jgi:hypothetical protein
MKKFILASIFSLGLAIGLSLVSTTETCADGACGREALNVVESLL